MDDFYLSKNDAHLPRKKGQPDWNSRASIDMASLREVVAKLLMGEVVVTPRYDMKASVQYDTRILDPTSAEVIIVEGLYAFDLSAVTNSRTIRFLLVAPVVRLLRRRLARDVSEEREGRSSVPSALLNAICLTSSDRAYNTLEKSRAHHVIRNSRSLSEISMEMRQLTTRALTPTIR